MVPLNRQPDEAKTTRTIGAVEYVKEMSTVGCQSQIFCPAYPLVIAYFVDLLMANPIRADQSGLGKRVFL